MTAIIEISSYYGEPDDRARIVSVHDTEAAADEVRGELNGETYRLDHNQASGHYCLAPVLDDDACYRTWVDGVDWGGCPHEDPDPEAETESGLDQDAENIVWAEQRAISEGGLLALPGPVDDYGQPVIPGGFVLVDLPPRAA